MAAQLATGAIILVCLRGTADSGQIAEAAEAITDALQALGLRVPAMQALILDAQPAPPIRARLYFDVPAPREA